MIMEGYPEFEDFQDFSGKKIRFKYVYIDAGNILSLNALEETDYDVYRMYSSYNHESQANNLIKIREIIQRELNTRYFSDNEYDQFHRMNFDYFKGNIMTDKEDEVCIVVDGKKMNMIDLEKVITPCQGFQIEIRISDGST